jgi:hypothetical protein
MNFKTGCCLVLFALFALSGCAPNEPLASFEEENRLVNVCVQNGDVIVTAQSCDVRSRNYVRSTAGGIDGGFALFADLCEGYKIEAFGYFDVVGSPPFEYKLNSWTRYRSRMDSLKTAYSEKDCRYVYEGEG